MTIRLIRLALVQPQNNFFHARFIFGHVTEVWRKPVYPMLNASVFISESHDAQKHDLNNKNES